MKLPTVYTEPVVDPNRVRMLLYGPPKIGKSTFCSKADKVLFLATEPGLNSLRRKEVKIENWSEFIEAAKAIKEGDHEYKTIVIDTVDNLWRFCAEHVCAESQEKYWNDGKLGYGKGRVMIDNLFYRCLVELSNLPYGLILVSHSQEKEIENEGMKVMPTLPEKAGALVLGLVDMILFCDVEARSENGKVSWHRLIRTKPSRRYQAGDRTGRLPDSFDLDYEAFLEAFHGSTNGKKGA